MLVPRILAKNDSPTLAILTGVYSGISLLTSLHEGQMGIFSRAYLSYLYLFR